MSSTGIRSRIARTTGCRGRLPPARRPARQRARWSHDNAAPPLAGGAAPCSRSRVGHDRSTHVPPRAAAGVPVRARVRRRALEQLELLPALVASTGIVCGKHAGYEADDFLGAAVAAEDTRGGSALVATSDRDAFQLASPTTTILQPAKGVSEIRRVGPSEVRERYGVDPAQVPDFIALRGDPSDRIPGRAASAKKAPRLERARGARRPRQDSRGPSRRRVRARRRTACRGRGRRGRGRSAACLSSDRDVRR